MNLFEKQQKRFAIKLSYKVKEEIKKTFGTEFYDVCDEDFHFHYPNYENHEGFKQGEHLSLIIQHDYTLITEAEFFGDGKELTPMQELIEYIKSNTSENGNSRLNNFDIISKATELLPKEKQVIEDAYTDGCCNWDSETDAKDYYNQKFRK